MNHSQISDTKAELVKKQRARTTTSCDECSRRVCDLLTLKDYNLTTCFSGGSVTGKSLAHYVRKMGGIANIPEWSANEAQK